VWQVIDKYQKQKKKRGPTVCPIVRIVDYALVSSTHWSWKIESVANHHIPYYHGLFPSFLFLYEFCNWKCTCISIKIIRIIIPTTVAVITAKPLQEFTLFIWWMQTELRVAANSQIKPTYLACESASRLLPSTSTITIYYYYLAQLLLLILPRTLDLTPQSGILSLDHCDLRNLALATEWISFGIGTFNCYLPICTLHMKHWSQNSL